MRRAKRADVWERDVLMVHMRNPGNIPLCRCSGPLHEHSLADEWAGVTCQRCRGAVAHPSGAAHWRVLRRIRCEDVERFMSNLKETECRDY